MTNSTNHQDLTTIIDTVLNLLNEGYLTNTIDEPIQRAVATFDYHSQETDSYLFFVDITSRFFAHINEKALRIYEKWSPQNTQMEWMDLLEKRYQTDYGNGFYMAYLDADENIEQVLSNLAGIFISILRQRHVHWVYFKYISGMGWSDKCNLIKELLHRNKFFPESILKCPPAQMVNQVLELISAINSVDSTTIKLLAGDSAMAEL